MNRGMSGRMSDVRELELYFHIPFCVKKCLYCDFLSAPADAGTREAYMKALLAEVEQKAGGYRDSRVSSVFVGGGTPSVVEPLWIRRLLETVRERFIVSEDAEITVEVNPGTVGRDALSQYRQAGVNRLSIGLQSADEGELRALGRIHTYEQFLATYDAAVSSGFVNINVDLMSALPGQSPDSYRRTLEKVLALEPRPVHISAYSLILEEGTPLYRLAQSGSLNLPDEDTEREMYHETKRILERAGYVRYEISNYALEGFACRHNCGYWTRREYLGFGLGASSFYNNVRYKNTCNMNRYITAPAACREEVQNLSREEQMEEFMFLGLRLTEGIDPAGFVRCFGCSPEEIYGNVIEKNIRQGLLRRFKHREKDGTEGERLALTELGLDVSNYVMQQFLLS